MKRGLSLITASALALVIVAGSSDVVAAQRSGKYTGPETGLLGVKLFDSGLKVLQIYGNPDSISAISIGTSSAGGSGGPPGGLGGRGGGAPAGGPPRGGGGGGMGNPQPPNPERDLIPGGLLDDPNALRQGASQAPSLGMDAPPAAPGGGGGPGVPGNKGGGGGAPAGGGGGATEAAVVTRWNYTRNGTKLAFVIDKFNRVLQIEAIGLQNARVKTRRGIGFGSTFRSVMGAYAPQADPDGYDIAGNNITVRFLTRHRVAFRLSQLSNKKSHVVTGIVVAAGKQ